MFAVCNFDVCASANSAYFETSILVSIGVMTACSRKFTLERRMVLFFLFVDNDFALKIPDIPSMVEKLAITIVTKLAYFS